MRATCDSPVPTSVMRRLRRRSRRFCTIAFILLVGSYHGQHGTGRFPHGGKSVLSRKGTQFADKGVFQNGNDVIVVTTAGSGGHHGWNSRLTIAKSIRGHRTSITHTVPLFAGSCTK